jgi:hypothetical protein
VKADRGGREGPCLRAAAPDSAAGLPHCALRCCSLCAGTDDFIGRKICLQVIMTGCVCPCVPNVAGLLNVRRYCNEQERSNTCDAARGCQQAMRRSKRATVHVRLGFVRASGKQRHSDVSRIRDGVVPPIRVIRLQARTAHLLRYAHRQEHTQGVHMRRRNPVSCMSFAARHQQRTAKLVTRTACAPPLLPHASSKAGSAH